MKQALLFLLLVIGAVFCGLVIAYFYLRRLADERRRVQKAPRVMPFPEKHPPVDMTPRVSADLLQHRSDATDVPDVAATARPQQKVTETKARLEGGPAAAVSAPPRQPQFEPERKPEPKPEPKPKPEPERKPEPEPKPKPKSKPKPEREPKPERRPQAAGGGPATDDLKRIRGIGPKLERMLNTNGIHRYRQIAEWDEADIAAFGELLPGFRGRIRRDDWVGQARQLVDSHGSSVDRTDPKRSR